ncbi:UBC core domain-containing protein [Caenorhabditis elegans]|uniref:UBC core domain-containing protein n=1 Tax=Caenorhabditis elegans TaxID=6239 RepID=Q9N2W9_CAEEL|nr:UBC core domain-containing protein [Caenorhabditis elegans]CCD74207.2 UBC core domain-containing protein [Caenorhabditis elegans]|eukprot:NP_500245.3 UBiquitin Conjugating enzyme [Caenorhabditis elegans]
MTSATAIGKRRIDCDVVKLISHNHEVQIVNGCSEFIVRFHGPKDTAYENGVWRIRVDMPDKYPFKSPSIGFLNKIFHPNIDEASGTVCLDVINQAWTALYDLTNIFDTFLPQLLTYPNAADPLNGEAARLYIHKPEEYRRTCREYVMRFASEHRAIEGCSPGNAYSISSTPSEHYDGHPQDDDDESCSSMSEFDESEVNFDDFDADDTMTVDQMEF